MDLMDTVRRPVAHDVKLSSGGREPLVGSLCVSAYYLLYSTRRHEGQDEITVRGIVGTVRMSCLVKCLCCRQMLNTAIETVEHKTGSPVAVVALKDFRHLVLEFRGPEEAADMADALRALSRPSEPVTVASSHQQTCVCVAGVLSQLYAFTHQPSPPLPPPPAPWVCSSPTQLMQHWRCSKRRWRISDVNRGFKVQTQLHVSGIPHSSFLQVCPSYPEEVVVPATCPDESLRRVADFRYGGRFPVLAYHHQ